MDVEGFSGAVEDVHLISLAVPHTMQNRFRDDVGPGKLDFNVRIVFGSEPLAYQVVTPEAAWPPASPLDTFPYSASACSASGC